MHYGRSLRLEILRYTKQTSAKWEIVLSIAEKETVLPKNDIKCHSSLVRAKMESDYRPNPRREILD
jgi:hypothetical protein